MLARTETRRGNRHSQKARTNGPRISALSAVSFSEKQFLRRGFGGGNGWRFTLMPACAGIRRLVVDLCPAAAIQTDERIEARLAGESERRAHRDGAAG